jgi:hypothetical protein
MSSSIQELRQYTLSNIGFSEIGSIMNFALESFKVFDWDRFAGK